LIAYQGLFTAGGFTASKIARGVATTASKVRGVATAATTAATTTSKVRREDVRGPRTGPRNRPHLVPRAAKRRADTLSGASSHCHVLPAPVLRRAYADPTYGQEHGAVDGYVSGSRPKHAAGKNDGNAYSPLGIDTRKFKRTWSICIKYVFKYLPVSWLRILKRGEYYKSEWIY